ncbi:MAG: amino acid adenylation domain-containing protein [Acidobacteriia bacterium]|nr:amino acid adenylation domain-containing protein [Terriglobia bacterium]
MNVAQRIAALSPEQRALLQRKVEQRAGATNLQPRAAAGPCPLSPSQQLMWLLNQLVAEPSVYHVPIFLRLRGNLNHPALEDALETIRDRHEVLRTTVAVVDGEPLQSVQESRRVGLPILDVPGATIEDREAAIESLCLAEARRPFDLGHDLPLRATLLRVDARDHILLVLANHLAFDGWSRKIFLNELSALYAAFCQGKPNPLSPLAVQYADFAVWQHAQSQTIARQIEYWKSRLAGAPQVLDLPSDRPRPAEQSFRGGRLVNFHPMDVLDGLTSVWRSAGATQFMTLLAAFNLLLSRYSASEDLVIGTPILGRLTPAVEPLIGYFSNTLLIRTDLSGDPTFRELLGRVRGGLLEALEHQDAPLELLTAEMHPERSAGRSPLFQVMFSLTQERARPPALPGLEVSVVRVDRGISRLDLTMGISIGERDFATMVEYSNDLFDAATIARMVGQYRTLLGSIAANPDERISRLKILPDAERRQLVALTNGRGQEPGARSVHALFEDQVQRTPEARAVESRDRSLTYAELNARANQAARCLRLRGAGPGQMVGLYAARSIDAVVGMLAILKTGAAAVPLDPAYPRHRLEMMIADTGMKLALGEGVAEYGVETISLGETAGQSTEDPESAAEPEDAAYVIYTSGSTGRPKGVVLTHRGLVNHHVFARRFYDLGPRDRVLQSSPISFDISLEEIFPALASGAAVVIRPDEVVPGGRDFLNWIEQKRITVLDLPTGLWHQWTSELAALRRPLPDGLRMVIVGGEKAQTSAFLKWREVAGTSIRWINTYGPTEASIIASAYEPGDREIDSRLPLPIGRPVAGARIYILDRHRQPVPIGVPGELYLGGEILARGYLNQPQPNAERFVEDPFIPGARCFKTGDIARFLDDGNIEFIGRADRQVKIRGYRVEPGEIESLLLQHPGVADAAVVDQDDGAGQLRLVAYVADPSLRADENELRRLLKAHLPDYMIPSAFVVMAELPRTDRGKLDRSRLPAAGDAVRATEHGFTAPRDAIEMQLARIWESVLRIRNVGVRDSFFDLGGHSLQAVAMFGQIEKVFGMRLPPATLFRSQTIEELAGVLRGEGCPSTWSSLVPIQPGGSRPPLFCVHAQSGHVVFYQSLANRLGPDQPLYGLQSAGLDGSRAPLATVEEMARHYLSEIRTVQPEGPYYLGGFCLGSYVAFEMARQLDAAGEKVSLLAIFETDGAWRTATSLLRGVAYHRQRMRGLRFSQRVNYLSARTRFRLDRTKNALTRFGAKSVMRWRGSLPRSLREAYVHETNFEANHRYQPRPFSGRIAYFGGAKRGFDPTTFWGGVAQGGVHFWGVPGTGRRIFREPNVQALAVALTEALDEARNKLP